MARSGVSTTVTELPESRVRVEAQVAPEEIEKRLAQSARSLGRSLRVPGFRAGKVPPPIVIQRVGREYGGGSARDPRFFRRSDEFCPRHTPECG